MLADAATVAEGKLYVHGGGWSNLFVDAIPYDYPSFSLVFVLEMSGDEAPGQIPLDLELVADDTPVAGIRGWIEVPADSGPELASAQVANQVTFTNVTFPAAGAYVVRVASDGEELGLVDLHVHGPETE